MRGLGAGDFVVYDRGEARELVGFEVVERPGPAGGDDGLRPLPMASSPPRVARNYLLLIEAQKLPGNERLIGDGELDLLDLDQSLAARHIATDLLEPA